MTDVVDALVRLLNEPTAIGDVFNIGSSEEISIEQLARLIIEKTSSTSPVLHVPYEVAYEVGFEDMVRRVPDVGKLEALTGWHAQHTLAEILDDVIDEVRSEVDQEPITATSGERLQQST